MEKYLQYKTGDFAAEDSFINWVNKSNKEDIAFWDKWIVENPSKKQDIEDARLLVALLDQKSQPNKEVEDKVWNNIHTKTTQKEIPSQDKKEAIVSPLWKKYLTPLAAAAAVIFVLIAYPLKTGQYRYTSDQIAHVNLPDGSTIELKKESLVKYPNDGDWEKERIVKLDGEAFFKVAKGKKFTVETPNGNVEVLGTSFDVYSRDKTLKVLCKTGKVKVTQNGKEIAILAPNQGVESIDNKVRQIEAPKELKFTQSSLADVFVQLEQTYNVNIDYKGKKQEIFTGTVTGNNIDEALQNIVYVFGLKYELDGKEVTITDE